MIAAPRACRHRRITFQHFFLAVNFAAMRRPGGLSAALLAFFMYDAERFDCHYMTHGSHGG